MMVPLAWCNLVQEKPRTLAATMGVAFALTLVFMQLGFLGSVGNTATLVLDQLDYDIIIVSWNYRSLTEAGTFPESRLREAQSVPGVERVAPFYASLLPWRRHRGDAYDRGKRRGILTLGFRPDDPPFLLRPDARPVRLRIDPGHLHALEQVDTMLFDERSDRFFIPREPGAFAEIANRRIRILGTYAMGSGFAAEASALVSDETFRNLLGGSNAGRASLGLLKVAKGADVAAVAAAVTGELDAVRGRPMARDPAGRKDVRVLTRDQMRAWEVAYWLTEKSIGMIFLAGVAVALMVGLVVVAQVLSSDIIDHAREYATLKAMGYTNRFLAGVVVRQALILSVFGYVPALTASLGLYWFTRMKTNLPILMTPERVGLVLVFSALMCVAAALVSIRKVTTSDPASLF